MSREVRRPGAGSEASRPYVIHVTTIDMSLRYLLLNQLLAIRAAGYRVSGMSAPGPDVAALRRAQIPHLPVALNRSLFTPFRDLRATWQMVRWFRRERPTIVHTHNPKPGFWGQIAARLAGVPYVVNTLHGFYFHEGTPAALRRWFVFMERLAARCSDLILSQSSEDLATAVQQGICGSDKISLLGNGIDLERFDPGAANGDRARIRNELGIESDALVVGFVGRLVREKGLMELLDAARALQPSLPGVRYLIVGAPDLHKPDHFDPAELDDPMLSMICRFPGHVENMPSMYAAMDLFCLPSHREGFPRAPMEAAAMGVPSVVTDIRGCREVVVQGATGSLVPVANAAALADALRVLLTNDDLRRRLGRAARERARQEFDERRVFRRVLTAYGSLIDEASRSPGVDEEV